MARQENQPRQVAWIIDPDAAAAERLIAFAQELKSGELDDSPATLTVTLSGTKDGTNFTGDPDEVASELQGSATLTFVSANAKAQFPNQGNAQGTLALNFSLRQLTVNLQKASAEFAADFLELVLSRFPPQAALSEEQEEALSLRLSRLITEAESAIDSAKQAKESADTAAVASDRSKKVAEALQSSLKNAKVATDEIAHHREESAKQVADISNSKAQTQADQDAARAAREQIGALEAQIRKFHEEIDSNRQLITESENQARETVEKNNAATKRLVAENESLQNEIKEHLQKAVGASLFTAFQKRKDQISGSKWVWGALVATAVVAQAAVFIWLATSLGGEQSQEPFYARPSFVLRALASIPIIFFIGYSIRQYARERDFEELYAFKAALSFSLSPYLDLVKVLSEKPETEGYRDFVVRTIGQIFENPRQDDDASKEGRRDSVLARELLDRMIDLMEKAKR